MKHVAALPGQTVCRLKNTITVDGAALTTPSAPRPQGANFRSGRTVASHQAPSFLMNSVVRDSLDGRYFGPIPARTIIGRATPIYTDEAANGQFVWRANARRAAR